jgi:hypothetical protein
VEHHSVRGKGYARGGGTMREAAREIETARPAAQNTPEDLLPDEADYGGVAGLHRSR